MDILLVTNLQATTKCSPSNPFFVEDTEELEIEKADISLTWDGPGSGPSFKSGTIENSSPMLQMAVRFLGHLKLELMLKELPTW